MNSDSDLKNIALGTRLKIVALYVLVSRNNRDVEIYADLLSRLVKNPNVFALNVSRRIK